MGAIICYIFIIVDIVRLSYAGELSFNFYKMFDVHSHIIYDIDDGSPDRESSRSLLRMAAASGTKCIVATPHVIEMYDHPPWQKILDGVAELRSIVQDEGLALTVLPGAEVMLSLDILAVYDDAPNAFCLNNTNYALVELPRFEVPKYTEDLFYKMQLRGLTPVLAHPECYGSLFQTPERLLEWCQRGVLLQCNGGSLLGRFGPEVQHNVRYMLYNKLISFVGSDAHRVKGRNTDLSEVRSKLVEFVGQNYADAICVHNPEMMLRGEDLAVVVPTDLKNLPEDRKGLWKRLFG